MTWENAAAAATIVAAIIALGAWLTGGASPISGVRHRRERQELEHQLEMQRLRDSLKPGQTLRIEEPDPNYLRFLAIFVIAIAAVIIVEIIWGKDDSYVPAQQNAVGETQPGTARETQKTPGD